MPKVDGYGGEDFQRLQKINGLNVRCFNYNSDIRNKTLIVDRVKSLVIEIKEEVEQGAELNGGDEEKILGNSASKSKTNAKSKSKNQQQQREKEIISFNKVIVCPLIQIVGRLFCPMQQCSKHYGMRQSYTSK